MTVKQSPYNIPASSKIFIRGCIPPIFTNSDIIYFPLGLRSPKTGTFLPILVKSFNSNFIPIAFAIASKCKTAFVDPPKVIVTVMALINAFRVIISFGVIFFSNKFFIALPEFIQSKFLSLEIAACEELPGKLIPNASTAEAIVFAVYIPPHDPGPGIAFFSILFNSFSEISSLANCPTASNTETISIFLFL